MKKLRKLPRIFVLLGTLISCAGAQDKPDFLKDVRPILSGSCFKCHGPDEESRKGELRLDVREAALKGGKSGAAAILPGSVAGSEIIKRILTADADDVMPPPSAKMELSEDQKSVLRRWVEAGADYQPHWAFVPPQLPEVPAMSGKPGVRNEIDAFVAERLEQEGLTPSAEADKLTLARRVWLDLLGFPPTPEEADAFAADAAPDAYEKLVDRLMGSPHYGERWARRWLDLARYADTNGYEKDRARTIWPWRDWVIQAFNADMPFDQFTVEQLAGDMLPGATQEQKVATGFHRNTMLNEEGGIDPLEFRYHAVVDRTNTTATAWLGLTLGCAQCHTHKYDPLTHEEYYRFFACLDNADELEMPVWKAQEKEAAQQVEAKALALEAQLPGKFPADKFNARLKEWIDAQRAAPQWTVVRPVEATSNLPLLTIEPDLSIFVSGDMTKSDTYKLKFKPEMKGITAVRLEVLPDDRLPRRGPGRVYYEGPTGDFTLCNFSVLANGQPVKVKSAQASFAAGGFPAGNALDDNLQTGWSVDGGQGKRHVAVFQLEGPLPEGAEVEISLLFERHFAAGLGKFRLAFTTDPRAAAPTTLSHETELLLGKDAGSLTAADKAVITREFCAEAPELASAREEIQKLRNTAPAPTSTLVFSERPPENPRATFVHHRGEFLQGKQKVSAGIPAILQQPGIKLPSNRLEFARWLVSGSNPLTARVVVNREWSAFFGNGIVKTVQDFGFQGELPTHPKLLDWLAIQFVKEGWSLKKLHRKIVLSGTYRQSSAAPKEAREKDLENRLLSRGPRFRMEAEMVRDSVLRASGLLSAKLGGPSVFPPQPAGVTTEGTYGAFQWKESQGEDRYRRALYTYTKRTAPYAMFATFDAPSGESCSVRRELSNTPLQSLTLLNDTVMLEAAQELGRKMVRASGSDADRMQSLVRACLTQPATADQLAWLLEFLQKQRGRITAGEIKAKTIAGQGEGDAGERAAWTLTARAIFNIEAAIVKE